MPSTTPTFGFPYPTSGDPISLGAEVIEALARAVEAKLRQTPGTPLAESVTPDPATLVLRDEGGRAQVSPPVLNADVVNLGHLLAMTDGLTFKLRYAPPAPGTSPLTITFVAG